MEIATKKAEKSDARVVSQIHINGANKRKSIANCETYVSGRSKVPDRPNSNAKPRHSDLSIALDLTGHPLFNCLARLARHVGKFLFRRTYL